MKREQGVPPTEHVWGNNTPAFINHMFQGKTSVALDVQSISSHLRFHVVWSWDILIPSQHRHIHFCQTIEIHPSKVHPVIFLDGEMHFFPSKNKYYYPSTLIPDVLGWLDAHCCTRGHAPPYRMPLNSFAISFTLFGKVQYILILMTTF